MDTEASSSARFDVKDLQAQGRSMWHPVSSPMVTQTHPALLIARGDGVYVWDVEGRRYFDAMSGLWCVNVGHRRPEVIQAITEQLGQLEYHNSFNDMTHPRAIQLAQKITQLLAEEGMQRVIFSSGGSDAVETALKIARQYWRLKGQPIRTKFIALNQCYHGMHFGGTALNGSPAARTAFGPTLVDCFHIESPYLYRNPWTQDPTELGEICAANLERQILSQNPDTVAAFIAEPVLGIGGVIVPPANFWPLVRQVCDKYGVLLIADEVVTGFGRSGSMSGSRGWGVRPDIMCLAKGLTSGYIPMGATAVSSTVAEVFEASPPPRGLFLHGYTYSGHPVAAAAALACLDIVVKEDLPSNAATVGQYMLEGLEEFRDFQHVGDVRGKALMAAIELVEDKKSKRPLGPTSKFGLEVAAAARQNGALVRAVGSLLIFSPPLVSTKADIDILLNALRVAFRKVDQKAA
jgi:adenosylmethionine-8-amino-7-oxononanoate aminotransferase